MKKPFTVMLLLAGAAGAYAQGTIILSEQPLDARYICRSMSQ
jgi:hypothetical protein